MTEGVLARVRRAAGLSQSELARRAGTSRPTVSAYEHGRKSPSLDTLERLLDAAGYQVDVRPRVAFAEVVGPRGRVVSVPDQLPRLTVEHALAEVMLPVRINWSQAGRVFRLANRDDRARVYEIVLREGTSEDVLAYVDGALLIDLWDELVLPAWVRNAWTPVISRTLVTAGAAARESAS